MAPAGAGVIATRARRTVGGGGGGAFVPQSGFGLTGSPVEDGTFTLTGPGGFGTKPNAAAPLLWMPFKTSATPSSLGRVTSARPAGQFTYSGSGGADGNGCYSGSASDGVTDQFYTVRLDSDSWGSSTYDWNTYDQKIFISRRVNKSFGDLSGLYNVKDTRWWGRNGSTADAGVLQAPSTYFSRSLGRFGQENLPDSPYIDYSMDNTVRGTGCAPSARWYDEEILTKTNSAANNVGLTPDTLYKWAADGGDYILKPPYTSYDTFYLRWHNAANDANDGKLRAMFAVHMGVDAGQYNITGSISGTVLTITNDGGNLIAVGSGVKGAGVTNGTTVTSFGTGTGGVGTYNLSQSSSVASSTLTTAIRPAIPYGGTYNLDDLYVDDSWCRIVLGDSATYTSCTSRRLMPPSAWADGSVSGTWQFGGMNYVGKHLFVVPNTDVPIYAGHF